MIYFVRHGESEANARGIFAGQRENSPLTEEGREQARLTAQRLKTRTKAHIDKIVSSPLKRAQETAKIIAEEIGFDPMMITTDDRVTEYDMGDLSGTPTRRITSLELIAAKGAEDVETFLERTRGCMQELSRSPENILVVSHAGVGRILETIRGKTDPRRFYDLAAYANASITTIDWVH